jgi:hypothetical protein
MTARPGFLSVAPDVARNPVARAIARKRARAAMTTFLLHIHMLADGDDVTDDMTTAARLIAVACRILDQRGQSDSLAFRLMTGAMSAIAQCSERKWRWRVLDAVSVDRGLTEAMAVIDAGSALEVQRAWIYVEALG